MKTYKQYNESIRYKMSPVSEEDIKNKMGEEKFRIYKTVKEAKESIKPPFEIDNSRVNLLTDDAQYSIIDVKIWFLRFLFRYDGSVWDYTSQYNSEKVEIKYKHWIEVYQQMIDDTNKFFNQEIDTVNVEINRHQNKIENMKKDLDLINKQD